MFSAVKGPTIPKLLLPQIEPLSIADTRDYQLARIRIKHANQIVLIGYSFGGMDDQVAYHLLISSVKRTKAPVIVIGPDVRELVDKIQLHASHASVFGLSAYWDVLAKSILASRSFALYKTCTHERPCPRCTSYAYQAILNGDRRYRGI